MAVVFFLLLISSFVLLLAGLAKPGKVFLGADSPRSKVAKTYGFASFLFFVAFIIVIPKREATAIASNDSPTEQPQPTAAIQEKSALDMLLEKKLAFAPGTYARGTIQKGEFIFISDKGGYYAEERDGQILDNENFDSFGYVYNHAIGDITTHGLLVSLNALKELNTSGAKDLYERLTKQKDYNFSGHYKVGSDIPGGQYIVESAGEAYVEVNRGPVGNGEILNNDNFNGTKSISLRTGQYLKLHKASITAATGQSEPAQPIPAAALEKAKREIEVAMRDPRKVRLMECIGVNPWKVKPDGWTPPTTEECDQLNQVLGAEAEARKSAAKSN